MINTSNIKIGETFRYKNYVLVCAPEPPLPMADRDFECCRTCFFVSENDCPNVKCTRSERKDRTNVIFKIDERKTSRINDGAELCNKLIKKYKNEETLIMLSKIKTQLLQHQSVINNKNDIIATLKNRLVRK